jgi:hypothetical protein
MRVALAMTLPLISSLAGCAELEPDFSTSQWLDDMEMNRPSGLGLHTPDTASALPGLWARSTARANSGENSWHFGDGTSYGTLVNASIVTPELEAGRLNFLRFSYWSDVPTLSMRTATDGAVVEARIDGGEWVLLDVAGGYPYTLDEVTVGSRLFIGKGVIAGTDREWHDEYVELLDAAPGSMVTFRFRFSSDIDGTNNMGEGLYIDDVEFLTAQ